MTKAQPERIVCGTDFSDNAAWALRWAAALAKRSGGEIDLVTAIAPVTSNFPELATDATVLDDALYDRAVERLAESAAAAERELGVRVQSHVVHAEVPAPLAAYAQEIGARLIVLGAHGRPPLERWLLGSVADRTIRAAACPVVVVPPPAPDRRGAKPAWAEQQLEPQRAAAAGPSRPLRVLVGLDGGAGGDRALGFARQLRAKIPADVTFLHLYWPLGEYQRLGVQGSRDLFEADPDVVRNLEPSLRDRIGTLPGTGSLSLSIRPAWGEPAANLLLAAEEGEHDLLIVGAEQRHGLSRIWHPSTSRRLVRGALTVPVVCVPAESSSRPSPAATLAAPPELPHFSVVLVPTDLSAAGNAAVPYAYALLGGRGGVIELCHIRSRPTPVSQLEAELRALVPPSAQQRGITTHVSVIDGGLPAEAIVQASERLGVDVISLGSHGAGALARVMLGSIAEGVVRNSRKPVLVVRSAPP